MIIIGVITILTILSQNPRASYRPTTAYDIRDSLGASVYPVYDDNNSYELYPNYSSSVSLTPIGNTPSYTTTKYYYYEYPQQDSYYYNDTYYNYNTYQGYVPPGCESDTDYSLTTGEPCG